jgi:GT2 family glycosyltransferase
MGKKFSVVIAIAPERVPEVLESLKDTNYPKNKYEVIVQGGLNPSENRNRGAGKAKGEIIAFIDDDARVSGDIFKRAEEFFRNNKNIDIVGGPQLTPLDERGIAKISGYALGSQFGAWRMSNRYSGNKAVLDADETMLTSANLFCRREVTRKIKFDRRLFPGEDPKFISDAKRAGFRVAYSPDIKVYHRRRASLGKLAKQIFTYGKTRPRKEKLSETLKMPFFIMPSLFLIYLVAWIIFALAYGAVSWFTIPLIAYIAINLGFSGADAIVNKNLGAFFILPFIYLLIHLSYGWGFLYGIFTRNRGREDETK